MSSITFLDKGLGMKRTPVASSSNKVNILRGPTVLRSAKGVILIAEEPDDSFGFLALDKTGAPSPLWKRRQAKQSEIAGVTNRFIVW